MQFIRFLSIPLLAVVLHYGSTHKRALCWLKAINHSAWEKTKWLVMPLTVQTLIESFFKTEQTYFPARLMLLSVSVIFFLATMYLYLKWLKQSYFWIDLLIFLTSLKLGFISEHIYLEKNILLHPYDPYFAVLGIFFILLIFILNTYYPPEHWFFQDKNTL